MAFGMSYSSGGSGDIIPVVKYDARAGRIFRVDRADGVNTPNDITNGFKAIVDMENVEVGFIDFPPGSIPSFSLVPLGDPFPSHPGGTAKQGVRVMMKLHASCGGDIRELATNSKTAMRGLDDLHTAYEAGEKENPGKLPVVSLKSTVPITSEGGGQKSTNYQPVFEIVGWVNRPVDLVFKPKSNGRQTAPGQPAQQRGAPPSTGATQVPPPAAKPAPQPAMANDDADGWG